MELPTKRTILLLAANFSTVNSALITQTAIELIERGLIYVLCWGDDCSRAEGAFDYGNVLWEEQTGNDRHIMSTSHEQESFEEALWFCLYNAMPEERHWDGCSVVIVSIGGVVQADQFELVDNQKRLSRLVL